MLFFILPWLYKFQFTARNTPTSKALKMLYFEQWNTFNFNTYINNNTGIATSYRIISEKDTRSSKIKKESICRFNKSLNMISSNPTYQTLDRIIYYV